MKSSFLKIVMSRVPIFVILGSTGTGKSKLGIEIAKKFNGEIISADSMQVYKGLDVITNKVTPEEAEGIPHHMLDFLDPNTRYTVVDYRNQALKHIDDILQRNKVPIIVGGTNYYIESLLWTILVYNKTNINDQGQFTLYDIDKIRNLEHGRNVLESLWKIDNEDKAVKDLFSSDGGSNKNRVGLKDVKKTHEAERNESSQGNEKTCGEKRKSDGQADAEDKSAKKIKTNGDEKSQTEIKISSQSDKKSGEQMISKEIECHNAFGIVNKSDISNEKTDLLNSGRERTINKSTTDSQQLNVETLNDLKRKDSEVPSVKRSSTNKINESPIINAATANPASNREGIKSLVTVLDSLRGKLITDIEIANRFSLGVRTLKDMMKPPREEDDYDKVTFKSTNVKGMFEELDKIFEAVVDEPGNPEEASQKEAVHSKVEHAKEPSTRQSVRTLYSDYKAACIKLIERVKYLTLLPKQFLYCLSVHQKSKSMDEKLSLYGLTREELKSHLLILRRYLAILEKGVKEFAADPLTCLNSENSVPPSSKKSSEQSFDKQLTEVLTDFEHHIGHLNNLIARTVDEFSATPGGANLPLSTLLLSSTTLMKTVYSKISPTRNHFVDGTSNHPVGGTQKHPVEGTPCYPVEGTSIHPFEDTSIHSVGGTSNHSVEGTQLESAEGILNHLVDCTKYFLPTDMERTNLTHFNLHRMLQEVDQPQAFNLHPNNIRKVVRALQVFYEQGRSLSDILSEQKSLEGGSVLGGPLRFPNTVILWLQCDKAVLDKRLESRVHTMIENGLVSELIGFHRKYNEERVKQHLEPDYSKGIFQSIGFKEFHPYLTLPSDEERESARGRELFGRCVANLVLANVQYAKRQNQWVRNRLLKCPDRAVPPVYSLNCTDLSTWPHSVSEPALHIVESYLCNRPPRIEPLPKELSDPSYYNAGSYPCDVCSRVFVGKHQYDQHMGSHRHRKMVAKMERQLQQIMRVNQSLTQEGVKSVDNELLCAPVELKHDSS